jgi:hypothetical protein
MRLQPLASALTSSQVFPERSIVRKMGVVRRLCIVLVVPDPPSSAAIDPSRLTAFRADRTGRSEFLLGE